MIECFLGGKSQYSLRAWPHRLTTFQSHENDYMDTIYYFKKTGRSERVEK